jgi:hypothetical protein
MPEVRNGGAKWKQRASNASRDYLSGVQRPRRNWQEATVAAADSYTQGVQQAAAEGRFARGVQRAGQQAYTKGVTTKGPTRYVEGINQSGDAYDRGFAPYAETIRSIQLTPRGRRGDPANYARVAEIGQALNAKRKDLLSGS